MLISYTGFSTQSNSDYEKFLELGKKQTKRGLSLQIENITDIKDYYKFKELTDTLQDKLVKTKDDSFDKAINNFEKALELNPKSQEANYFLGSIYDKKYTFDYFSTNNHYMIDTKLEYTRKISSYFENSIKNNSVYRGEVIILGPSSKITSCWAIQAMTYIEKGKKDSAVWALKEGKKRGGFSEPILELCRNILTSCDSNAILFVNGDNDTFPMFYIQLVEGFRKDITFINMSLSNLPWIIKILKYSQMFGGSKIPFSFADDSLTENINDEKALNVLSFYKNNTINIPVNDIPEYYRKFSESEEKSKTSEILININIASADYAYETVSEQVIIDIIKLNKFNRPLCFSITIGDFPFLKDYFIQSGLVNLLVPYSQQQRKSIYKNYNQNSMELFIHPQKNKNNINNFSIKSFNQKTIQSMDRDSKNQLANYYTLALNYASYIYSSNSDNQVLSDNILDSFLNLIPKTICEKVPEYLALLANYYSLTKRQDKLFQTCNSGIDLANANLKEYPEIKAENLFDYSKGGIYNYYGLFTFYYYRNDTEKFKSILNNAIGKLQKCLDNIDNDLKFIYEKDLNQQIETIRQYLNN